VREYIWREMRFRSCCRRRFKVPFTAPSFDLYRALRSVNPSPICSIW